jgi:hypothetical protein
MAKKSIAERAAVAPTALHEDFAKWLTAQTGVEVDLKTVQLVTIFRMDYQASPENQANLAARKANAEAKRKGAAERKKARLEAELAKLRAGKEEAPKAEEKVDPALVQAAIDAITPKEEPAEAVKLTILYKGNGEPEVHKQGCADIKRNRRKGDSQETVTVSSHTEITHIIYADMIDSGESSLEDNYMAYNAKPCCPKLDN